MVAHKKQSNTEQWNKEWDTEHSYRGHSHEAHSRRKHVKIRIAGLATAVSLSIGLLTVPALHADTYRWVDANGVVNYSERKPRGVPESQVTVVSDRAKKSSRAPARTTSVSAASEPPRPAPAPGPDRGLPSEGQPDLSPEQQAMLEQLQDAEAQRQAQVEQIRKDNCDRARQVLANLSNTGRIRVVGEDGLQRILPENERSSRIEEAQKGVATNCEA